MRRAVGGSRSAGGMQANGLAHFGFQLGGDVFVLFQELFGILAALPDALAAIAEPGARFFNDVVEHAQIEHVAGAADAFAVHDVELGLAEGRGGLVLNYFDLGTRADYAVALFDGGDAADIHAHAGVKLEGAATGGGLRIAEHDADLFANLVDENQAGSGLGDDAGELAQRLRHEPRLQAHVAIAHFAFQFGFGDQRRDRIHHQHVNGARADQRFGDLQRLLAVIGLGDEQVVHIHAEFFGVSGIERVLGIDKRRQAAGLLRFRDHLQGDGGLAAGFRAENFDYAAARKSAHAQSGVEADGAGGDDRDGQNFPRPQAHDGAFAKLLFDLRQRKVNRSAFFVGHWNLLNGADYTLLQDVEKYYPLPLQSFEIIGLQGFQP